MGSEGIERVSAAELSSRGFIERFADPGLPVILLDVVPSWPAFREWRAADGEPDYDRLRESFGGLRVPVVVCGPGDCEEWDAGDYLAWAKEQPTDHAADGPDGPAARRRLYLKDWHMARDCKARGLPLPYTVPEYLDAPLHDWLNLYKDAEGGEDDYRFCYVGVAGTATPLHHDVLLSHSWSASICGRKRWVFFLPADTPCLLDARGEAVSDAVPGRRPEGWEKAYPRLEEAWERRLEVIQEPGELIFVPSGWYHQVDNLTAAVSINHNWIQASNAAQVWGFLQRELAAVHKAIGDLRDTFDSPADFEAHCQTLMRCNCGLDCAGWLALLAEVAAALCREAPPEAPLVAARLRSVAEASLASLGNAAPLVAAAAARLSAALELLDLQGESMT